MPKTLIERITESLSGNDVVLSIKAKKYLGLIVNAFADNLPKEAYKVISTNYSYVHEGSFFPLLNALRNNVFESFDRFFCSRYADWSLGGYIQV